MKYLKKYLLVAILLIAAVLRLWHLGSIPPSLTSDEAALGYNAYSILKTGKDEYGKAFPIIFKSFGDYKPGFYIYLTVPSVAILGLNEFTVRLPSAIGGIASVFLIYLVVKKLFSDERLALASSFIAAINPWSIFFSRGAWEVNIALTLTLAGIYFFFISLEKQKYLVLSAFLFSLTLITYQGAKLATGIVVGILLALYWRQIFKFNKKIIASSILIGAVVAIPIVLSFFGGGTGRLTVFSLFSYPRPVADTQALLSEGGEKITSVSYYLFHSESLDFLRGILTRFFNHFSPRFLFFEGDWENAQHSSPYQGVLLLGDIVLLIAGMISFIREKMRRETLFVWLWMVLSVLPSILSRDQVHAVRALNLSIPLIIILAFGVISILKLKNIWKVVIGVFYAAGFIYFLDSYFIHLSKHNSQYWNYGYKQIVETVVPLEGAYKTIKVQPSFAQPYIYFLFYQKYDPAKYQAQAKLTASDNKGDVGFVEKLDNICFCAIDWSLTKNKPGTLVVADLIEMPREDSNNEKLFTLVKEIDFLNGKTAFRIVGVK